MPWKSRLGTLIVLVTLFLVVLSGVAFAAIKYANVWSDAYVWHSSNTNDWIYGGRAELACGDWCSIRIETYDPPNTTLYRATATQVVYLSHVAVGSDRESRCKWFPNYGGPGTATPLKECWYYN